MPCWPDYVVIMLIVVMMLAAALFGASIATAVLMGRHDHDDWSDNHGGEE